MAGATGSAPTEATNAAAGTANLTDQTDGEIREGRRQAERRAARLGISPKKTNGTTPAAPFPVSETIDTGIVAAAASKQAQRPVPVAPKQTDGAANVIPFSCNQTFDADNAPIDTGNVEAARAKELQNQSRKSIEQQSQTPKPSPGFATQNVTSPLFFDHAIALEFYSAVRPSAFILSFTQGRSIKSAEEFQALIKEADDKHEHLFFHVATLKPDWTDPARHVKRKVTTAIKEQVLECSYLWGDCDAPKYKGDDPVEAAKHYETEGSRIRTAIDEGLHPLGITPFAIWRSGAGWQFLIKLDQAIEPDEAEPLVGKLHAALGFDPVVRNCNRILRVPGSVNWKDGKDGRVPSPCMPLHLLQTVTKIDDVRKALAGIKLPVKEAKPKDQEAPHGEKFEPSEKYEPIEPDDPLLAKLGDKWRAMITADNYAADYKSDHSRAEFAVVCEAIRVNIDDDTIARVIMDWRRKFGGHTRERADYRLPRIISRGHEFAIDPDLARMNAEHAVVCIAGKFGVASWQPSKVHPGRLEMVLSNHDNFTFGFSNEKKAWETTDKDGNPKLTKIALGAWWLRHEHRRQYNGGVALMPWIDAESENGILNLWTGFGFKPAVGNWSLFKRHIFANLCGGNEEYFGYLIRWMAWIVQNRKQSGVAVLLRGDEEGTGKGFFARHYGMLFAEHFMQLNNPEHVIGKFNPHLQNLLLLNADEALFVGDPRHRNALWGLTTEPTITIEPKHFPAYKARNFLNHIITTNAKHAVEVTRTARRIFALDVAPNTSRSS